MMILWRRHKAGCATAALCRCRKEQKRECHCCRCPIWAGGYFGGSRIRKSLDTGDWAKAQRKALETEAELNGETPKKSKPKEWTTVIEAQEQATIARRKRYSWPTPQREA